MLLKHGSSVAAADRYGTQMLGRRKQFQHFESEQLYIQNFIVHISRHSRPAYGTRSADHVRF